MSAAPTVSIGSIVNCSAEILATIESVTPVCSDGTTIELTFGKPSTAPE